MSQFIREIEPGVELFRDAVTGIAWAEDHRTGLGVSVHPNIDESGSLEGMIARGWAATALQGATDGFTTSTGLSAMMRTRSRLSWLKSVCALPVLSVGRHRWSESGMYVPSAITLSTCPGQGSV